MNLTVNSQQLASELRLLAQIIPAKPSMQILGCVLLTADDEHQKLAVFGTNLEVGLTSTFLAAVRQPGRVVVPFRKLLQLVEQFPNGEVILEHHQSVLKVSCGSFQSRLQTAVDDFPTFPAMGDGPTVTFPIPAFARLMNHSRYAVSDAHNKYILKGTLLTVSNPVAAMVGTDSKQLSLATVHCDGPDIRTIIPLKTLDTLRLLYSDGTLELTINQNHLFFRVGSRLIISRVIDGEYPRYEKIIPIDNLHIATVDRNELKAALKRVTVVSEDVVFDVVNSVLMISSRSDIGLASEDVSIGYDGPALRVGVSGPAVLDFLNAADAPRISIALKDERQPMLLSDGSDHISVVMLMR